MSEVLGPSQGGLGIGWLGSVLPRAYNSLSLNNEWESRTGRNKTGTKTEVGNRMRNDFANSIINVKLGCVSLPNKGAAVPNRVNSS